MTVRLVALMSFVLLLSLAATAFLMHRFQEEVIGEVQRTASEVGRAALSSLESGAPSPEGGYAFVVAQSYGRAARIDVAGAPGGAVRDVGALEMDDPGDAEPGTTQVIEWTQDEDGAQRTIERVFFRSDAVHVDRDPSVDHLVLRIPRFLPRPDGSAQEETGERVHLRLDATATTATTSTTSRGDGDGVGVGTVDARDDPGTDAMPVAAFGTGGRPMRLAKADELRFPIPLNDYADLFARLQRRSLFLFLGVFVVGSALSAGLAARFTRPIRRLDAGIHRISDGDLDVEVDADGKGEIARLGRAFNEMTSRLRAGRDRSREMVRREKLSALGGLAAGVAHDVRNPLHSIGLTLQHLREACRPETAARAEEFDRSVDIIRGEVRRLDQLVGNFLRFARSERRERQPVDLADLLRETERLIRKEAEWRGVEVTLNLNLAVPAISADGESLRSAILNLVLNSFEAMPDGGRLTLTLGVEGDCVRVDVEDTGHGIPESERERVFEFAYTTRESGSGLGLAMVHQAVVEEHGGRVVLDSAEGRGTRVRLSLPIRPPERTEPAVAAGRDLQGETA